MRSVVIILSFIPFLHYGVKDNAFHFRGRKVTLTEHVLHFGIGVAQAIIFVQALRGDWAWMLAGVVLCLLAGAIDEYIFHRHLPGEESDLHAKQHLALLIFLIVATLANLTSSGLISSEKLREFVAGERQAISGPK